MTTIGFIGTGNMGGALARAAFKRSEYWNSAVSAQPSWMLSLPHSKRNYKKYLLYQFTGGCFLMFLTSASG